MKGRGEVRMIHEKSLHLASAICPVLCRWCLPGSRLCQRLPRRLEPPNIAFDGNRRVGQFFRGFNQIVCIGANLSAVHLICIFSFHLRIKFSASFYSMIKIVSPYSFGHHAIARCLLLFIFLLLLINDSCCEHCFLLSFSSVMSIW